MALGGATRPAVCASQVTLNAPLPPKAFSNFTQCKAFVNDSTLPYFDYLIPARLIRIHISNNDIVCVLKALNSGKSNGTDETCTKMLLFCGDTITITLQIIFESILSNSIFPDVWKTAHVVPIHKEEDKQLLKHYRPIFLLPICAKMFGTDRLSIEVSTS